MNYSITNMVSTGGQRLMNIEEYEEYIELRKYGIWLFINQKPKQEL